MTWIIIVAVAFTISSTLLALNGIDIRITKTIIHVNEKEEKEEKEETPAYNKSEGVEEYTKYYEQTGGQNKF